MGKQLWYAFRHFVPLPLLDGFLTQCTDRGLKRSTSIKGVVEPGFDEWILENLAISADGLDIRKEVYPPGLLKAHAARLELAHLKRRNAQPPGGSADLEDDDDSESWD